MPVPDIYFPFIDGALSYDCRQCGGYCCRGNGLLVSTRELAALEDRWPGVIQLAAAPPSGLRHTLTVIEPPPRCFFLQKDGLCRVERELGRAAKPAGCRLFPVLRLMAWEGVLFVDLAELCPFQLRTGSATETPLRHDDLRAELGALDDPDLTSRPPPLFARDGFAAGVRRERDALGIAGSLSDAADWPGYLEAIGAGDTATRLGAFLGESPPTPAAPEALRALLAAAGLVRARCVTTGATSWGELPRVAGPVLAALGLFSAIHARLMEEPPTPSSILHLYRELAGLLHQLARLDEPLGLVPGARPRVAPALRQPVALVLAASRAGASLGEAVAFAEPEPRRRASLLRGMGDLGGAMTAGRPQAAAPREVAS